MLLPNILYHGKRVSRLYTLFGLRFREGTARVYPSKYDVTNITSFPIGQFQGHVHGQAFTPLH